MQRTVLEFTGARELRWTEEPIPSLQPGEVLVRTTRTLISTGTESICYTRNFAPGTHFDNWVRYPFRSGYLQAGVVEAVGDGVESLAVGDRVATRGGHASHVVCPALRAWKIPEGVSDEAAAWTGLGKITQVGIRAAEHRLGDAVVVIGLGLLGQLVVQYAVLGGARLVVAVDPAPERLEWIRSPRVTKLALGVDEAAAEIAALTAGRMADVVYDVTGHHAVFAKALPLARDFGTVVVLGDTGQPHLQTLSPDVIRRGLRIVGAHDNHAPQQEINPGIWTDRRMCELFLHYLATGQIEVEPLITHRVPPARAKEIFDYLQTDREKVMGVVFEWS
ncbi:MAG: theronine dehydrogenase [Puniceicoccaceae bacterium]|nr:MAG: theronine dehydrogenase [Puniceicoccaceae bacterium]